MAVPDKENRIKLAYVGGGSYQWAPRIIRDIMLKEDLKAIDFMLLDKDVERAGDIKRFCERMNAELHTGHTFTATQSEEEAFSGCDFVIICISTGGLEAMRHDLAIPEKYGIYQTVGDSVGPGGWSRNLRNVPVFNAMAEKIERLSNNAVVLNYTNPMACLTQAFYARTSLRAVGLCHGLYENYEVLQDVFGLQSEKELNVRFGGVNHFFWMLEMKVNGRDGYGILREKLGTDAAAGVRTGSGEAGAGAGAGKRFLDLINERHSDEIGFSSNKYLSSELYETFGYVPYIGDRHTCEFLPHVITGPENRLSHYHIQRTTVEERYEMLHKWKNEVMEMIDGRVPIPYKRTRESAADIVEAVALGKEFIDIVNVPNRGQIPNLPLGTVVETLGVVNALGFTPVCAGPLPEPIRKLVLPHAENSFTIYEAASTGNFELALEALYNEPCCQHLDYADIRRMGRELLEANREYVPQFF